MSEEQQANQPAGICGCIVLLIKAGIILMMVWFILSIFTGGAGT